MVKDACNSLKKAKPVDWNYLVDLIYSEWAIFVKQNHAPRAVQEQTMTKMQEGRRKTLKDFWVFFKGDFVFFKAISTLYLRVSFCITCWCGLV